MASAPLRADFYVRLHGSPGALAWRGYPGAGDKLLVWICSGRGEGPSRISAWALEFLMRAPQPGNMRQLRNEVRRLLYLCLANQPIAAEMVTGVSHFAGFSADGCQGSREELNLRRRTEALAQKLMPVVFQRCGGWVTVAAELVRLSHQGLRLEYVEAWL